MQSSRALRVANEKKYVVLPSKANLVLSSAVVYGGLPAHHIFLGLFVEREFVTEELATQERSYDNVHPEDWQEPDDRIQRADDNLHLPVEGL